MGHAYSITSVLLVRFSWNDYWYKYHVSIVICSKSTANNFENWIYHHFMVNLFLWLYCNFHVYPMSLSIHVHICMNIHASFIIIIEMVLFITYMYYKMTTCAWMRTAECEYFLFQMDIETPNMSGKIPMVRIRNPWGNEAEWKGRWSDQ